MLLILNFRMMYQYLSAIKIAFIDGMCTNLNENYLLKSFARENTHVKVFVCIAQIINY
jgi:hypothetical protein